MMNRVWRIVALALPMVAAAATAQARPGLVDRTFGVTGRITTRVAEYAVGSAAAVQPDQKIVVAGYAESRDESEHLILLRYATDGSLDATFGKGGIVTTTFGDQDRGTAVALRPDGKIIVVGHSDLQLLVTRFTAAGKPDPTFGTNGVTIVPTQARGAAVALLPDGRILAGGSASPQAIVARFEENGTLDPTFGTAGIATALVGTRTDVRAIAVQPDGKLVAGGEALVGGIQQLALMRFTDVGALDPTFGTDGVVTSPVAMAAEDLERLESGAFVAVGTAPSGPMAPDTRIVLTRYDEDGALDTTFGVDGVGFAALPGDLPLQGNSLAVQADGGLFAAGRGRGTMAAARFHADGTLDVGFGAAGMVTLAVLGDNDIAYAAAAQADGKLVAVGQSTHHDYPIPYTLSSVMAVRFEGGDRPACGADTDGDGTCDALDVCVAVSEPAQVDGDGDGLGDACDPCTSESAIRPRQAKLKLGRLLPPATDDQLTFKGNFALVNDDPPFDPVAVGMRFLLTDVDGAAVVDVLIPGGAGWKVSGSGTSWTWRATGPAGSLAGLTKIQLKKVSGIRAYKVALQGRGGSYAVAASALPLTATVVLTPPMSTDEQCLEALFALSPAVKPTCVMKGGGSTVTCG